MYMVIIHMLIYYNAHRMYDNYLILLVVWGKTIRRTWGNSFCALKFDHDPEACPKFWWGISKRKIGAHNIFVYKINVIKKLSKAISGSYDRVRQLPLGCYSDQKYFIIAKGKFMIYNLLQ